jgi:arsenical pump membrane protein
VTVWSTGFAVGLASNMMNNLPVGLIAGSLVATDQLSRQVVGAMLIGVDLGPNLSVTGSLATILWLSALRCEGQSISKASFVRLGVFIMTPALAFSLFIITLCH